MWVMPTKDSRIDAYIVKAAAFARPILKHLRKVVHAGCPKVEETIKWGMPHFEYKGPLCGMAAFKQHCSFGFWKGELVIEGSAKGAEAMGQFGRLTAITNLPSDKVLADYVRKAADLNEAGIKRPSPARSKVKKDVVVPDYFNAALAKNRKARETFEGFSPSHRKEYVEWITEAKREETRAQRIKTAIEWLVQGKSRNWKYVAGRKP